MKDALGHGSVGTGSSLAGGGSPAGGGAMAAPGGAGGASFGGGGAMAAPASYGGLQTNLSGRNGSFLSNFLNRRQHMTITGAPAVPAAHQTGVHALNRNLDAESYSNGPMVNTPTANYYPAYS